MVLTIPALLVGWVLAVIGFIYAPTARIIKTLGIIIWAVALCGEGAFLYWHFEKEPSGHLIVERAEGPFFDKNGLIYVNITAKNNGTGPISHMLRRSGSYFDERQVKAVDLDAEFVRLASIPFGTEENYLDSGEEFWFRIFSLNDCRSKYDLVMKGQAQIFFIGVERYKDDTTPYGYVYEKQLCFQLTRENMLQKCNDHNQTITVKL